MGICKLFKYILIIIFLTKPFTLKAESNLLNLKVTAADFALLKYETFLNKNFNKLVNKGGLANSIIFYEYVDSSVKYNNENKFLIKLNAYMSRHRYSKDVKYIPNLKDCNTVRNRIFLNKIGYNFFSQKKNNLINENDLNEVIISQILNFSGITRDEKIKIINETKIVINIIHPIKINSIKCTGSVNQVELF